MYIYRYTVYTYIYIHSWQHFKSVIFCVFVSDLNSDQVRHTLSQQMSVEKLGVFRSCKMWINLAQYTASEAVKQQRGNTHSWRNWVMVSFFVDPVKYK